MRGMVPTEFGKRMARARKARGWSRAHLADMAGVSRVASIHELERGVISEPRQHRAVAIAAALGVPLTWLWGIGERAVPAFVEPVRARKRRKRRASTPQLEQAVAS